MPAAPTRRPGTERPTRPQRLPTSTATESTMSCFANTGGRLAAFSVRMASPDQLFNRYVAPEFNGAMIGCSEHRRSTARHRTTRRTSSRRAGDRPSTSGRAYRPTPDPTRSATGSVTRCGVHRWSATSAATASNVDRRRRRLRRVGVAAAVLRHRERRLRLGVQTSTVRSAGSYFVRDAVVWSTPALVDLDGDGALDVVVGTGLYFLGPAANQVMAINGRTGQLLW